MIPRAALFAMIAKLLICMNMAVFVIIRIVSNNKLFDTIVKEAVTDGIERVAGIQIGNTASFPALRLPPFAAINSSCDTNPDHLKHYCKAVRCDEHQREIEEGISNIVNADGNDEGPRGCKTLWFAGMRESPDQCREDGLSGYQNMYGAALNSATINARDTIQPVLMLGRLELEDKNASSKFGSWARKKGALVIVVPRLEYQEVVDEIYIDQTNVDHRQGPWLRLEIPRIIKEHGLFDLPRICQQHVLYTDSDVIFANKISEENIKYLTDGLSSTGAIVSYGRQQSKRPGPHNTGVMVIDVPRLSEQIPGMFRLLKTKGDFGAFDQGLINEYFHQNSLKRHVLPIHYNWKIYWKLEPSTFDQVKIIHMHGPKPGRGLEAIASCNATIYEQYYSGLIQQGICCDKGRTALWGLETLHRLFPPSADICD